MDPHNDDSDFIDDDDFSDEAWAALWGESLAGRLLIAMPNIGDPRFERAVILMCVHSPDQAMGITVNRPMEGFSVRQLMEKLGMAEAPGAPVQEVLSGGPVERERGFVLHTDDYISLDSTLPVGSGVSLTATREVLAALTDDTRRPSYAALALGCAQWSPGQLEKELAENVWLTADPDLSIIFDTNHETKWSRALARLGVTADRLSGQTGRA